MYPAIFADFQGQARKSAYSLNIFFWLFLLSFVGAPAGIRTPNQQIMSLLL
jgi:hypothetical protein